MLIQQDKAAGVASALPSLHIDVYAAQTGVSRFLEVPGIMYNKTEELVDLSPFDYLLTHNVTEGVIDLRWWARSSASPGLTGERGESSSIIVYS